MFSGIVRLERACDNVLAAFPTPSPLIEHAEGLTDAGGVSQKYLQPSATWLQLMMGHSPILAPVRPNNAHISRTA